MADNWVVSGAIHRVVLSGKTLFVTAGQPFGETGFHLVTFIHFLRIYLVLGTPSYQFRELLLPVWKGAGSSFTLVAELRAPATALE